MECDSRLLEMLQHPDENYDATVIALVNEIREAVLKKANAIGGLKPCDDEFVVGLLFNSKEPETEQNQRDYSRAVMSVMIEFLDWVCSVWGRSFKPTTLLTNFLFDLGYTRLLSENGSWRGRSFTWVDNFNFFDLESAYLYDLKPQRMYGEALCIFGLRQTMENKFSRMVGFARANPKVKMPHNFWPKLLHKYVASEQLKFADKTIDIHRIMRIYNWTNSAIHGMRTDFVWLVWKAFQVCRPLFLPMEAGGVESLVDSASIDELGFRQLRSDAITAMAKEIVFEGETCQVEFSKPELIVVDAEGQKSQMFDINSIETVVGLRKRKMG